MRSPQTELCCAWAVSVPGCNVVPCWSHPQLTCLPHRQTAGNTAEGLQSMTLLNTLTWTLIVYESPQWRRKIFVLCISSEHVHDIWTNTVSVRKGKGAVNASLLNSKDSIQSEYSYTGIIDQTHSEKCLEIFSEAKKYQESGNIWWPYCVVFFIWLHLHGALNF